MERTTKKFLPDETSKALKNQGFSENSFKVVTRFQVGCTIRKLAELKRSWKNMMEAEKPLQNKGFQLPFLF